MAKLDKLVQVNLSYFCPSTGTDGDGDLEIYGSLSSVSGYYDSNGTRHSKQSFALFQRDPGNPDKIQVNVHRNNVGNCIHRISENDWLEVGGVLAEQDTFSNDELGTYTKIFEERELDFTLKREMLFFQDQGQVIEVQYDIVVVAEVPPL